MQLLILFFIFLIPHAYSMELSLRKEQLERNAFFLSLYEFVFKQSYQISPESAQAIRFPQTINNQLLQFIYEQIMLFDGKNSQPKKTIKKIKREKSRLKKKGIPLSITSLRPLPMHAICPQDLDIPYEENSQYICCSVKSIAYPTLFKHIQKQHFHADGTFRCPKGCSKKFKRPSKVIHHLQDYHHAFTLCCNKLWNNINFQLHRKNCSLPLRKRRNFQK